MMTSALFARMPSLCVGLLEDAFREVAPSSAAQVLELSATCLDEYAEQDRFRDVRAVLRQSAASGLEEEHARTLSWMANDRMIKFALAPYVEVLARAAGLSSRVEEMEAAVGSVRNNPVPWWFSDKFSSSNKISLFSGALAVGGPQTLDWLTAYRELLEDGRLPDRFSFEPHLLWISDQVHHVPLLHATGGIVVSEGDEERFLPINEPGRLKIRALLPTLRTDETLIVEMREDLQKPRILEAWREGKISARMLDHLFKRKYQIVKNEGAEPSHGASPSRMTERAFRVFQHRIRTTESCLTIPPNDVMEGVADPWISFDLWTGGLPTMDVWAPLRQINGLHIFVRGNLQMRSGIYDQHFKTAGDEVDEDVRKFFELLATRLDERVQERMPKPSPRATPPPIPHPEFARAAPQTPIPEEPEANGFDETLLAIPVPVDEIDEIDEDGES